MVTELGRQPWILYHIMTVQQALTSSPYVAWLFYGLLSFFMLASVATIYLLVSFFRAHPLPMLSPRDGRGPDGGDGEAPALEEDRAKAGEAVLHG